MNSIIYKDLKSSRWKKLFAGLISAILIVVLCISCADNKTSKEHIGITAEYEDALFEKGKLNDIQINMDSWEAFDHKKFETPVSGSAEEQLRKKEYDSNLKLSQS